MPTHPARTGGSTRAATATPTHTSAAPIATRDSASRHSPDWIGIGLCDRGATDGAGSVPVQPRKYPTMARGLALREARAFRHITHLHADHSPTAMHHITFHAAAGMPSIRAPPVRMRRGIARRNAATNQSKVPSRLSVPPLWSVISVFRELRGEKEGPSPRPANPHAPLSRCRLRANAAYVGRSSRIAPGTREIAYTGQAHHTYRLRCATAAAPPITSPRAV